jgi:hypothetical protein
MGKPTMFTLTDLQACEPSELTVVDGVDVDIHVETDTMGHPRVDVTAGSRGEILAYVIDNWGMDDPDWFDEYVVARIRPLEADDDTYTYTTGATVTVTVMPGGHVVLDVDTSEITDKHAWDDVPDEWDEATTTAVFAAVDTALETGGFDLTR